MRVVFASRGGRRHCNARARNRLTAFACATLVAALIVGAGSNDARANSTVTALLPQTACAPDAHSPSLLGLGTCPASQGFTSSFNFPASSPVLDLRGSSFLFDDITDAIPKLHFDVAPSKPVLLTSLAPPAAVDALIEEDVALTPPVLVGIASTYNPLDPGDKTAGDMETASGETYDELAWTAAIRTDLRDRFGGVRYGRNYEPTFALVESGSKRVIVRINDVGPLRPGRIIDLNKRAMRYFDPSLELGLISGVSVTPLAGSKWKTGPVVDDAERINLAGDFAL
jgi:rare lipoprotein A